MSNMRYVGAGPSTPDSIVTKKYVDEKLATDTILGIIKLPGYSNIATDDPFYTYGLVGGTANAPHTMYVSYLVKAFSEWGVQIFNSPADGEWEIIRDAFDADVTATLGKADNSVQKSGNETVGGTKTFSANPIVPAPTQPTHATTKTYVDTRIDTRVQNYSGQANLLWTGTQSAYDALPIKDAATVYIIT